MSKVSRIAALPIVLFMTCNAVQADELKTEEKSRQSPPTSGTVAQKALALPKAAAGIFTGLAVGVPVKITKDIKHETRRMAGVSRGDMGNEFGVVENVFVAATSIPYGLVSGFIMGGIRGTERAFTYGARQPFSKESLGLAEPEPATEEQKQPISSAPKQTN